MYVVSELKLTASYTYLRNGSCNCWKHNSFLGVCRKKMVEKRHGLKSETHAFINCIIFLNGDVYFVLDGPNRFVVLCMRILV